MAEYLDGVHIDELYLLGLTERPVLRPIPKRFYQPDYNSKTSIESRTEALREILEGA